MPNVNATCPTEKTRTAQSELELVSKNLDSMAQSMGMNETCKRSARDKINSGIASFKVSVPFASAGGQASFMNIDNKMEEEGCGTFVMDSRNILNSSRQFNCHLQENAVTSEITTNAGAKITMEVTASEEYLIRADKMDNAAISRLDSSLTMALSELQSSRERQFDAYQNYILSTEVDPNAIERLRLLKINLEARLNADTHVFETLKAYTENRATEINERMGRRGSLIGENLVLTSSTKLKMQAALKLLMIT